jgi:formate hydrogenlyase transcriptional activator
LQHRNLVAPTTVFRYISRVTTTDLCHSHEEADAIIAEGIATILSSLDLRVVLERTGALLRRTLGVARVGIVRCLAEPAGMAEFLYVDDPDKPTPAPGTRFPLAGSAAGAAIAARAPLALDHVAPERPRYFEERVMAEAGYQSLASFPLVFEGQVLGALNLVHAERDAFRSCCLLVAAQLAQMFAIALHNSLMVEEVRRLNQLLSSENTRLREELTAGRRDTRYVAESPLMREVIARVAMVAPTDSTVLIRGDTGTGKEGLARMVHEFSQRFGGPFVTVNLGAIPETLVESELFGHEKGAFTGATARKLGRFEQAAGGTIFLDEVGDATPSVQVRLLRVLQEREIQRVGGADAIKVDVRVVAATNRPLEQMVQDGTFRADLYYRLSTFPVVLPPLRERPQDIRPLATYFLARHAGRMNRRPPHVAEPAWAVLEQHDWPGNVRELENYLERSLILCPGPDLTFGERPGAGAAGAVARPPAAATGVRRFDEAVRDLLRAALAAAHDRIYGPAGAAALLGLKPTTLQSKLQKYGIKAGAAAAPAGPRRP